MLRLVGLDGHDFWFDEALEIARDRLPWPRILFHARGPDPPLFRVLMSPLATFTSSEVVLRLPSVALSVATIWLVWCWVVRLGDTRLALVTAALLAIAPVQVHYAQEVSQYGLAGCVGAAILLAMQRVLDRGAGRDWGALGAALVAAVLSYYGLVFLIAAVDLVLLRHVLRERHRAQLVRLVAVNALVAAILALLAWLMLLRQFDDFASTQLSGALGERSAWQLLGLLAASVESDLLRFFWMPWSDAAPSILLLLPAALAGGGAAGLAARGGRFATPLAIGGASVGLMWVAHLLGLYPFGFRYALFLSPLLFLLVAEGLCRLARHRALAITVGLAVVTSQVAFLPNLRLGNPWLAPPHENLARVLDWVAARSAEGAAVYVYYGALPAFALYRDRIDLPVLRGINVRQQQPAEKVAAVQRAVRGRERFFLVASHLWGDEKDVLVSGLAAAGGGFRLVDERVERGAYAALLERVGPT